MNEQASKSFDSLARQLADMSKQGKLAQSSPEPLDPAQQLAELSKSGKLKEFENKHADPAQQLAELSKSGFFKQAKETDKSLRQQDLDEQDRLYLSAYEEFEARPRKQNYPVAKELGDKPVSSLNKSGYPAIATDPALAPLLKKPTPPIRSNAEILADFDEGIEHLRANEVQQFLTSVATNTNEDETVNRLVDVLRPKLPKEIKKELDISQLTKEQLKRLQANDDKIAEFIEKQEQSPEFFIGKKTTDPAAVGLRNFANSLALGYAFSPDSDRLASEDLATVANERALALHYQQQDTDNPISAIAGSIAGQLPYFVATRSGIAKGRLAAANKAMTNSSALSKAALERNALIIKNKGYPSSLKGAVAFGGAEGLAYDIAARPLGAENLSTQENISARVENSVIGALIGSAAEAGILSIVKLNKLIKDNKLNSRLKTEAKDSGFNNPDDYLQSLLATKSAADGRSYAIPKKDIFKTGSVTEEATPQGEASLNANAGEFRQPDVGTEETITPDLVARNSPNQSELEDLTIAGEPVNIVDNLDGSKTVNDQDIPKGADYVPNPEVVDVDPDSIASKPFLLSAQKLMLQNSLSNNIFSGFGGAVFGGLLEDDLGSAQWWVNTLAGAAVGVGAFNTARRFKISGEDGYLSQFRASIGQRLNNALGVGNKEIEFLKRQQKIQRLQIERQAKQTGEFLYNNFTPAERIVMADLIETRGIPKAATAIAKQAQELDDFIQYSATQMKELGMLPDDMDTSKYLRRYYTRHKSMEKKLGKSKIKGGYTIGRGIIHNFKRDELSDSVVDLMKRRAELIAALDAKKTDPFSINAANKPETEFDLTTEEDIRSAIAKINDTKIYEYLSMENPDDLKRYFTLSSEAEKIDTFLQPHFTKTERHWSARNLGKDEVSLWRDWTKPERESWGEIEDAGYRFVRSQAEVAHDVSIARFFKTVADNHNWAMKLSDENDFVPDGWIEIPNTNVHKDSPLKKFGALAGHHVRPDIYNAIKHVNSPLFGHSPAAKMYRKLLGKFKVYSTVYNPVSHFNNTVSNTQMYFQAGYNPAAIGAAIKAMKEGEANDYIKQGLEVGLFNNTWAASLLNNFTGTDNNLSDLAERMLKQNEPASLADVITTIESVSSFKERLINARSVADYKELGMSTAELAKKIASAPLSLAAKPLKAATSAAKWLYTQEDNLFKLAVFISELNKKASPEQALQHANAYFFDYSSLPKAVQNVRDFPIGAPFISYSYFAVQAVVRNAIERPERMFALVAAFEALNFAGLEINGDLEEQGYWDVMNAHDTISPTWLKGRQLYGNLNSISLPALDGYKISLANAHPLGNPALQSSGKDYPLFPSFLSFFGADHLGGNPAVRIPNDIITNSDWKGQEIYPSNADMPEILEKSLKYAYRSLMPTNALIPASWHQTKIIDGLAAGIAKDKEQGNDINALADSIVTTANFISEVLGGTQFTGMNWRGEKHSTRDAVLSSLGVKLRPFDPENLLLMKLIELRNDIRSLRETTSKKARGNYTKEQQADLKDTALKQQQELQAEYDELMAAYKSIK